MHKLKTNKHFSKPQLAIFVISFALIGFLVYKSFASNPNLPGDLNNDNTVNITDLSILLSNYGTTNTVADINNDGTVSILDLSILLSHYGQSVNSFTTNITQNMTITPPFDWTFDPGVTTTAGYFYADGIQLSKITGPGPYSFSIQSATLTAGTHTLGGSWDLADGTHVTFPQSYTVTISGGTTGGGGPGTGYTGPWRDTSYTVPTTFTKTITTAAAFKSMVSTSGSLVAGDVVHVVGPMTLDGCAGCNTSVLKKLAAPGASIYFDSNVTFAGDTNTTVGYPAVFIDATNISFYGGVVTGGQAGDGVKIGPGLSTDTADVVGIKWWGLKVHDVGASGVYVGGNSINGKWLTTSNIDIDAEVWNIGLQQQNDSHSVKGTGLHALYVGGSNVDPPGGVSNSNSKFSIYSHDITLAVGDAEIGQAAQNDEFWVRVKNLSFAPTGTSNGWGAARAFTPWTASLNSFTDKNLILHDVEAINITGPVVVADSLGSGPITVEYGRGTSVLQNAAANSYFGGHAYQPNANMIYQDVLP